MVREKFKRKSGAAIQMWRVTAQAEKADNGFYAILAKIKRLSNGHRVVFKDHDAANRF
jgi:hypothetical protein